MASVQDVKVPFFKKGKSRPTTARKRSPSPSNLASPLPTSSKSEVVLPTKKAALNLLTAGTKRSYSQRDEGGDSDAPEREGPDIKWSSENSHINTALEIIAGDEAEELLAKRRKKEKDLEGEKDEAPDDGLYHGQSAYKAHIKKNTEIPKSMRVGPQRSTNTIRTVTIVDYQPDVCKDYKETGYCGFGDTCKFLHDRGTYLAGWQLDKLAENPKKQVQDESDDDDSDEDIPFACLICRQHYTDPVVTRCGHYYCSACAIKRYAKTPKCLACGAPTGGIFNRADKIIEKIHKKKQKVEQDDDSDDGKGPDVTIEGLGENSGDESNRSNDSGD
ncbi:hypothetical protein AMATHDRAFT_4613 [Amanita thiersii Skay4041]|uniref:Pre-mRNA-splicing factor CWC24 n=1 Tax=Amanita thiersii Skay4041 TaxID=703135 RepID=A0A2A9NNB1_9AGAR|nr:hypothetical protein AMATHDRAFT_4613 [Amanita thiersii Skay4041]